MDTDKHIWELLLLVEKENRNIIREKEITMIEKGFNLQVFELKESIIKILNDSALPMVTKSSTVNEIAALLAQYTTQAINADKAAYEASIKEKEPKTE